MKRFVIKVFVLFIILVVIDKLFGVVFDIMVNKVDCGETGRISHICNRSNEELLVFGSSRAAWHYNPRVLSDSLELSCFNCGEPGNGIVLHYPRLLMVQQRYRPRMIIYDVTPGYDLLLNDNQQYLGLLKPYYERKGVKEIFQSIDYGFKWKMESRMYRYNSIFLTILADRFIPNRGYGELGFRPQKGIIDTMKVNITKKVDVFQVDSFKVDLINRFIDRTTGTKMVFVLSPLWTGLDDTRIQPLRDICNQRNIALIDFSNDPKYVYNNKLFKDYAHLNSLGADEFTKDLIVELKRREMTVF